MSITFVSNKKLVEVEEWKAREFPKGIRDDWDWRTFYVKELDVFFIHQVSGYRLEWKGIDIGKTSCISSLI